MSKLPEDSNAVDELEATESIADPSEVSENNVADIVASYQAQMSERTSEQSESADNNGAPLDVDTCDAGIVITTLDTKYSGIEIGDINEDVSEKSNLSQTSTANGSQQSLNKLPIPPTTKRGGGQDMNGNPEVEEESSPDVDVKTPASNYSQLDVTQNIGSLVEDVPLDFCIRVICRRFLLGGVKEQLIPDRVVRVSSKALALGCVSYTMILRPQILFMNVFKEVTEGKWQCLCRKVIFHCNDWDKLKTNHS
jgi:huntingtin